MKKKNIIIFCVLILIATSTSCKNQPEDSGATVKEINSINHTFSKDGTKEIEESHSVEIDDGNNISESNITEENILGIIGVTKVTNDMSPKGANIKYIFTNKSSDKETLLEIYARSVYEADLDGDGITEIMVYLPGKMQSIRIYDRIDDKILYIDVNEKLGSIASYGMENMSGYQREYENHLIAVFQDDNGKQRLEIYKVENNGLIYVGPFKPK
ncbi:hypothetical protein GE107_25895 [Cohnella sp. CFH 77786]|uniref:hypothetical protein n=1 Tax=Cohnella sp. CFH 77786 TaxID=2662265 RepID=UPI001C60FD27|nr:hypothetical protein [Cohnella sp. CFH 77786]MBW5449447.1 hypothetical protein [Cohnella sp. CFH 77786]